MSSMFSGQAEQRQFGKNGVDVIDEFCEASIFDEAARYLTKTKLKLSNDQKLTFYALFKQATVGPCNTPKPSILSMYERTKWNAWNDLGKMSKDEAITRYVNELEKVAPSWHEESGVIQSVEDDEDDSGKGGNGADGAMVMPQSRPVHEEEVAESELSPSEKHIWHYAGTGNIDAVKEWIKKGVNVNEKDAEGRTPLHWAVDRAHVDLVRTLLTEFHAEVNEKDADGSTPLHYAALCDHAEIVKLLIMNGANPYIEDGDGETSEEAIRGMKDITPEIIQIMESSKAKSKTE